MSGTKFQFSGYLPIVRFHTHTLTELRMDTRSLEARATQYAALT